MRTSAITGKRAGYEKTEPVLGHGYSCRGSNKALSLWEALVWAGICMAGVTAGNRALAGP